MYSRTNGRINANSTLPPPSPPPPPPPPPSKAAMWDPSDLVEIQRLIHAKQPSWRNKNNNNKKLTKQHSMGEIAWEKRRRQILKQVRKRNVVIDESENITDEDLHELKGSIELGFGFNEQQAGQQLCNTLPALDLYFAVNRQLSVLSPISTPNCKSDESSIMMGRSPYSLHESPRSDESWKICSPGDNPQQVKTRLRHWAQAVACSVMQSF